GGGEGVAPGDDTAAVIVIVGGLHHVGDLLIGLGRDLVYQLAGQVSGGVEGVHHLGGAAIHDLQHFGAIQELAAHDKPKFFVVHVHNLRYVKFLLYVFHGGPLHSQARLIVHHKVG